MRQAGGVIVKIYSPVVEAVGHGTYSLLPLRCHATFFYSPYKGRGRREAGKKVQAPLYDNSASVIEN